MEVPLLRVLVCETCLFQEVVLDIGRSQLGVLTEMHTDEFTESRGVVVPHGLCVTVGLKDGVTHDHLGRRVLEIKAVSFIGKNVNWNSNKTLGKRKLQERTLRRKKTDLILNTHFLGISVLLGYGSDGGEVLDDLLRVLGLSRTRLTSNQDRLVLPGLAVVSNMVNSNMVNSMVVNSMVVNSMEVNSMVVNSMVVNSNMVNSNMVNSMEVNSNMVNSMVVNSRQSYLFCNMSL